MLQNIPTHVIAGPLGAGKTSLLRHLLAQRPAQERWAVLVNEFGQIGLDAALLGPDKEGIAIGEVAGGCLCCVNGAPFQVGLGRLLRRAQPDRLFIEPSGLGHPLQLLEQLRHTPWAGVLAVQPLLMVLDGEALGRGQSLPQAQSAALVAAGLVVLNKSASIHESERLLITSELGPVPTIWTDHGKIPLDRLPTSSSITTTAKGISTLPGDSGEGASPVLWTNPRQPICQAYQGEGGWSIGWRWHCSQRFDERKLSATLGDWPWRRAKGVIHSASGWQSFNALRGGALEWRDSEWRKDSRIELIFDQPQPQQHLSAALAHCLVDK